MPNLKIEEIQTTSNTGLRVVLTGLDPTSHDFIIGTIDTPGLGVIPGRWDSAGLRRNGAGPADNLDPNNPEIAELITLARQLGAP